MTERAPKQRPVQARCSRACSFMSAFTKEEGPAMELMGNPKLCYGCGTENPMGLRLELSFENGECRARLHVKPELTGWREYLHGGVLAAALDEMMGKIVWKHNLAAMTGRLTVRYRQAVRVGEDIDLIGRIDKVGSRLVRTTAEARLLDGTVVADAEALYIRIRPGANVAEGGPE
jgi:acyl-coenzyme A thioesterase PaaI-like protein